jgi:hypothetical protein
MTRRRLESRTRTALENLIHRHSWLIDHGAADRLPDLCEDDGRLIGIGADKVGRQAIAAWAGQRAAMTERRSRHAQTNLMLEPVSPDLARGTVIPTLYRHDGAGVASPSPLLIGEFDDIDKRSADRRLALRRTQLDDPVRQRLRLTFSLAG